MKVTPQARGSGSPFTRSYRPHFIPVVMTTLLRAALEMLRIQASYYRQENNTPERESPGAVRGLGSGGDAEFKPLASLAPVPDLLFLPKKIVRGSFRGGKPKDSREEGQMVIHGLFCGWVCEQGLPPRPHESCLLTAGPADFGSVTEGVSCVLTDSNCLSASERLVFATLATQKDLLTHSFIPTVSSQVS